MTEDEDRASEEVQVDIFEDKPNLKVPRQLEDGKQDDESDPEFDVLHMTEGEALGGQELPE